MHLHMRLVIEYHSTFRKSDLPEGSPLTREFIYQGLQFYAVTEAHILTKFYQNSLKMFMND